MAVEKIPIELDLKTAKALRDALKLKTAVKDVGNEADKAGKEGTAAFDGFSKSALGVLGGIAGIGVGLHGAVALMKRVAELQVQINTATAEAIRQQQDRLRGAAERLGSPLTRNLAQQLGVSELTAFQRAGELSAQFDIPQQQVEQALLDLVPRFPRGQAPIQDVLTFARGTGAGAPAATQLFSILRERFGLTGAGAQRAAAGVAGVAQESALTPENLLRILTPTSAGLFQAGIEDPVEQAALAAAFAQFEDPNAPELTKTALKQLTRIGRQPADGFTRQLLRDVGVTDPDNFTITDLIAAYQKFLQGGATADERRQRVRQLSTLTKIPPRVLDKIAFTAEASFGEVFERTLAAGQAATFGDIRQRATARIQTPEAQTRSAETRRRIRQTTVGAIPGGRSEAAAILGRLTSQVGAGIPEVQEELTSAFVAEQIAQRSIFDEPLTEEQSRRLFRLIQVWMGSVRIALSHIEFADNPEGLARAPGTVGARAGFMVGKGDFLMGQAQEAQRLPGLSQKGFADEFESHIAASIQFIRLVQTGGDIPAGTGRRNPGDVSGTLPSPTGTQTGSVRGAFPAPQLPAPSGAGVVNNISNQTNIINGTDPATAILPNRGTATSPGEAP